VSFPPGLDETRIAVVDSDAIIAETILRAADNHRPGRPTTWDWQLNRLHYARTSPWRPDELGLRADVERITRGEDE
jgi:hypothetical protein